MKLNEGLDEIRAIRHQLSAECGHDVGRFFEMLKNTRKITRSILPARKNGCASGGKRKRRRVCVGKVEC